MNDENLMKPSPSEARELGRAGGVKSGIARKRKKLLRELAEAFGQLEVFPKEKELMETFGIEEKNMSRDMQIVVSLYKKAIKGDVAAFNAIRDLKGEKPKDEVALNIPNTLRVEIVGDNDKEFPSSEDEIEE